ncbi:MAG: cytidylate kinase family protein [Candidatus Moraniibacteriota bacterium]
MIISISGLPGSGKSTVAKMLAEKLGFERVSMGGIFRRLADQKGITILELIKQAETDGSIDEDADRMVSDLGRNKDNFIIESRTAFHFIPDSLKIFVKVDLKEGAKRIFKDLMKEERNEEDKANSANNLSKMLEERIETDKGRYQKYYSIDITDLGNYDLVVDSTSLTPEEVVDRIMVEVEKIRKEEKEETKQKVEVDM